MAAEKYKHIDFKPPAGVSDAARAALQLRASQPKSKRGGTAVGIARARTLANRQNITPSTAKRMKAYFDRHEVDKQAVGFKRGEKGFPSRGKQAWELWGGDAGYGWAKKLVRQINAADAKAIATQGQNIKNKVEQMASLRIYDPIGTGEGELSAKAFKIALDDLGDGVKAITIHVNSQGGSVIEGIAIAGMIERYPAKVTALIEGGALSIASYIVMKADVVVMSDDAWIMIHNPMTAMQGDSNEFRKTASMMERMADQLVDAYEKRTGINRDKIKTMMDEETWMTADEAISLGFVDKKTEPSPTVQPLDVRAFRNVPHIVASAGFKLTSKQQKETPMAASIKEIKAACKGCSAEFVLTQLETEATVGEALAEFTKIVNKTNSELKEEVESLKATIAAMEEEYKAMEEEKENAEPVPDEEEEKVEEVEEEEKVENEEDEKEKKPVAAQYNRSRQPPVRRTKTTRAISATAKWNDAVAEAKRMPENKSNAAAVKYVHKTFAGLRQQMIDEVNNR